MNGLSVFLVCLALAVYVVLGGVIFHFLERQSEETSRVNLLQYKQDILGNFTCLSEDQFEKLSKAIIKAYDNGVFVKDNDTSGTNWDYNSAIFFATTVVTTIGYGHISPITHSGRIFCCFFAMFGIPLFLIAAGGVGERIVRGMQRLYNKIDCGKGEKYPNMTKGLKTGFLVCLCFVLFLLIPAAVFASIENWNYGESLYFCFITMTTIGFGDYVPGGNSDFANRGWYRLCVSGWILIGLAWMASIIAQSQGLFEAVVEKREKLADDNEGFNLQEESHSNYGANDTKK